jgi:hypothetical protein
VVSVPTDSPFRCFLGKHHNTGFREPRPNTRIKILRRSWWTIFLLTVCLAIGSQPAKAQSVGSDDPVGVEGGYDGYIRTGSGYDPYTGSIVRSVTDFTVQGAVGKYGLHWTRTYHSRRTIVEVPVAGPSFGTRGQWTHSYNWTIGGTSAGGWQVGYPDGR